MKTIIRPIIFFLFKIMFGWNKTVSGAYLRFMKSKVFPSHKFDEVFVVREIFKKKNNGVLIDIGAHTGSFFENFIWKEWKIFAFEPDPAAYKQKILNDFQSLNNVMVFNAAVSNESGKILPFYASEESSGISSLHSFTVTHKKISEVKTITMRDFIKNYQIPEITIMKIDTEGHDYFVLQGIPWETIKPQFIMCEFENRKTIPLGYSYNDIGLYLLNKGYRVFVSEWEPIDKYGLPCKWVGFKEYPCSLDHENGWGNFLCFSPEEMVDISILNDAI